MAIQFVTYDDKNMEVGKFYQIHANLDQASAVIEVKIPYTIEFANSLYINEEYKEGYEIDIWRVDNYNGHIRKTNITSSVEWYIEDNRLILISNLPITGYIKFK